MGDPTGIASAIFTFVFLVYWGVAALCLYLAWSRTKTASSRTVCVAIVVAVFGFVPAKAMIEGWQAKQRTQAAAAHFKKRCAESGEKIYRVVENVEAIFLAKPRARATHAELQDQFWMGDPYGYSLSEALSPADAYLHDRPGTKDGRFSPIKGYGYVEMPASPHKEGVGAKPYVRFHLEWQDILNERTNKMERRLEPLREEVSELRSQYGVTWEDISTIEDRNHWVAGGRLTVFDLRSREVVGERIGYVFDPALGNTSGGRQIWRNSTYCPRFENEMHRNKEFVAKVLKASQGAKDGK